MATLEGLTCRERQFTLRSGDALFVYTDGVTEAEDPGQRFFGEERLTEVLKENRDASCKELLKVVRESIDDFAGEADQFDDITMLAFLYKG